MDEAAKVELDKEEIRRDLENRERLKRRKKRSSKQLVSRDLRDLKMDPLLEEKGSQSDDEEGDLLHKEIPHKLEITPVINKRDAERQGLRRRSCWRRFEDFVWLENHEYFYICCIHEYCGLLRNKSSPNKLICIRVFLLALICIHAFFDLFTDGKPIFKEFRYWGLALTVLVCFVNLLCAFQYKACLASFILELSVSKSRVGSRLMSVDSQMSLNPPTVPGWQPGKSKRDPTERPTEGLDKTTSVKESMKASLQNQQRILQQVDSYLLDIDRKTSLQQDEDEGLYYSSRDDKSGNFRYQPEISQQDDGDMRETQERRVEPLHENSDSPRVPASSVTSTNEEQYSALILNYSIKKYSPFHLFKWATILYQMAFLF